MATEHEVVAIIARLGSAYPGFAVQPETIEVYVEMLADIPGEALWLAARQHMATSRFFPTIAELREQAQTLAAMRDGPPPAIEAWEQVSRWISCSGRGRDDLHPIVERAVASVGGWSRLGQANIDDRVWTRKRFLEAYGDLVDVAARDGALIPEARRLVESGTTQRDVARLIAGIGRIPRDDQALPS